MLTEIVELLENKHERKPNEIRALGILLIYSGLSCRKARNILSSLDKASYEAIREWYHRAKDLSTCRERRAIAIDETKIKVKQEHYYLWAAIDIDTWEILGVQLTETSL